MTDSPSTGAPPSHGPPPAAPPPPPGQPAGVPPLTEFAWRYRLIRPVQGRTFAGVSGAFARATDTDPVLWRVVLVVLTIFGGIGLLIYLLAWLLLPADGDTATPLEALGGRGRSRTSSARTIVGLVIVAIALAGYFSEPYRATPLIALLVLGGVLLLLLRDRSRGGTPAGPVTPPPYTPPPAAHVPYGAFPPPVPPVLPPPGTAWSAPVPPVPPVPAPRRPRSRLGGLTVSFAVLLLGGLGAADLAGVSVPTVAYFAAPLAVIGLGLLVGTWVGRARWLIPLGIALSLAVGGGWVAVEASPWTRPSVGSVAYAPDTVAEIAESYHRNFGDIELDLTDVNFTGADATTTVRVDFGSLRVILPSDVDVVVDATVSFGDSQVLGESWSGVGDGSRTITDTGIDGTGGGRLHLIVSVGMGSLEVDR